MSEPQDLMFQALVQRAAPAQRDPLFRLGVLERRETQQFHRRTALIATLALLALALGVAAVLLRPPTEAVGVVSGVAASLACFVYAPQWLRRVSFFPRSR